MAGSQLDFRLFLLQLSKQLQAPEVEQLKFLLDFEPAANASVSEGYQILHLLLKEEKLSPVNFSVLKELFNAIGRTDLVSQICEKERGFDDAYNKEQTESSKGRQAKTQESRVEKLTPSEVTIDNPSSAVKQERHPEPGEHIDYEADHIVGELKIADTVEITEEPSYHPPEDMNMAGGSKQPKESTAAMEVDNSDEVSAFSSDTQADKNQSEMPQVKSSSEKPGTTSTAANDGQSESSQQGLPVNINLESLQGLLASLFEVQGSVPPTGLGVTGAHPSQSLPLRPQIMGPHMMGTSPLGIFGEHLSFGPSHMGHVPPQNYCYRRPPPKEYYVKNGYQVRIVNAERFGEKNEEAAVVEIKDGTVFEIKIENGNEYDAQVDIEFGERYLGIWKVESRETITISGSAYEPGDLVFHGKDAQQTDSFASVAEKSKLSCVFQADADAFNVRWLNGQEERIALSRLATVMDLFYAANGRLEKAGIPKDVKVRAFIKVKGELIIDDDDDYKLMKIKECGVLFDDHIVALTTKEKLYIQIPDGSEICMELDPVRTPICHIQAFVGRHVGVDAVRVRLKLKGIALKTNYKRELLVHFAETDHPLLIAVISPEFTVKLQGGALKEGETLELKVHRFMKISKLRDTLRERLELITYQTGKMYYKGKRMAQASLYKTLEDTELQDGDVIELREVPDPPFTPGSTFDSLRADGYDAPPGHIEDRSLDFVGDLSKPDERFGSLSSRGLGDYYKKFEQRRVRRRARSRGGRYDDMLGFIGLEGSEYHYKKYQPDEQRQKFERSLQTTLILCLREPT